ncbi:MAG: C-terminal binding protein, partial [Firmicutes bacterium]|nr:C-terminal binding protein [Bacillota bacterium]
MKVYLTDPFSYDHYDFHVEKELFKDSGIELILANCRTEEDVVEQCGDADGILDIYTKIGPIVMDGLPN